MTCRPHSGLPALCPKSRTWRQRDGLAGAPVRRRPGPSSRTSLPPWEGTEPEAAARLVRGAPPGTGCRHWTQGRQAARGGGACTGGRDTGGGNRTEQPFWQQRTDGCSGKGVHGTTGLSGLTPPSSPPQGHGASQIWLCLGGSASPPAGAGQGRRGKASSKPPAP